MNDRIKKITERIGDICNIKPQVIVAIDGRCASGKTTLASELQAIYACNVIHMDHFFLRKEQRTKARLQIPGENIDHERFLEEVLLPLKKEEPFSYAPYNCSTQELDTLIPITPHRITIIEGSYACHPDLWDFYDFHIYLSVSPDEQIRRIIKRDGFDKAKQFRRKWIPMEESYFEKYHIANRCEERFE